MAVWAAGALLLGRALADEQTAAAKPQDLTSMSLSALLHEEITPINVLGSHTHLKGSFMVGYTYMFTDMAHNQTGTKTVSTEQVLQSYPVVHTHMTMQMQMVDLMYAPSDWLTLMAMAPFEKMTMDHQRRDGSTFTSGSSGLGDVGAMAMVNLVGNPLTLGQRLVLNFGFTAPTGSINEKDGGAQLEYFAQLGAGTWAIEPGLTYLGESENWSWGAQALGTVRLGWNDHDYRLGDAYRLGVWGQYKVVDWFAPSVRFDWHQWYNIHGADPAMDPARNPAFDASKQAGERLDFLAGLSFYVPRGFFKGNRLSIEGGIPVYQNLSGPNMGIDWMIGVGWSWTFH